MSKELLVPQNFYDVGNHLKDVLKPWLYNILANQRAILCGGYLRALYKKDLNSLEQHNAIDYDIYFRDEISLNFVRDALLKNSCTQTGDLNCNLKVNDTPSYGSSLVFNTDNAITIAYQPSNGISRYVQLIKLYYGAKEASDVYKNFDFSVCKCGWDFYKEELSYFESFIDDNNRNELKIDFKRLSSPIAIKSLHRICKYIKKNYFIRKEECVRLLFSIYNAQITSQPYSEYKDTYYLQLIDFFKKIVNSEEINSNDNKLDLDLYVELQGKFASPYCIFKNKY